jgi:hypothetical protein
LAWGGYSPPCGLGACAAPQPPALDTAAYLSTFPDAHAVTPVTMASASSGSGNGNNPPNNPVFRSLFQATDQVQPVSPTVRELWGNSSSLTSVASAAPDASATSSQTPTVRAPQPLDLFSDRSGTFSEPARTQQSAELLDCRPVDRDAPGSVRQRPVRFPDI